jgi:hypothetical protein
LIVGEEVIGLRLLVDDHIGFNDLRTAEETDVPHITMDEGWSVKSLYHEGVSIKMISVDECELEIAIL